MGAVYATVSDVITLTGKTFTAAEQTRLTALLTSVSAELRVEGSRYGKDIDALIAENEDYGELVKEIVITASLRYFAVDPAGESIAMSQTSESALGYSVSGTYLVPGGGLYFTKGEKRRLGFLNQKYGVIDIYGTQSDDS